jgi:glyoxylate reductase
MFYLLGTGLQGKTLGVVGMGAIGVATARRARAFGMNVIYQSLFETFTRGGRRARCPPGF